MNSDVMRTGWATATSRNATNGRVTIFRYIKDFDENFDRLDYPIRVVIVWEYDSETGMPAIDMRERMDATEDALSLVVEEDGFAILALVSTGENLREWTYYVASETEFMTRLNQALAGRPKLPVSIHIGEDTQWAMYDEFKRNIRE